MKTGEQVKKIVLNPAGDFRESKMIGGRYKKVFWEGAETPFSLKKGFRETFSSTAKKKDIFMKQYFSYDPESGILCGTGEAMESPREPGVFLLPAHSTFTEPPAPLDDHFTVWDAALGAWVYIAIPPLPEPEPEPTPDPEPELPELTFDEKKTNAVAELWQNYKDYQRKYVVPEDLTLANTLMIAKHPKGTGVTQWVLMLWARYYEVKASLESVVDEAALSAIDLTADICGEPPFTIRELNAEAAAMMLEITAPEVP